MAACKAAGKVCSARNLAVWMLKAAVATQWPLLSSQHSLSKSEELLSFCIPLFSSLTHSFGKYLLGPKHYSSMRIWHWTKTHPFSLSSLSSHEIENKQKANKHSWYKGPEVQRKHREGRSNWGWPGRAALSKWKLNRDLKNVGVG